MSMSMSMYIGVFMSESVSCPYSSSCYDHIYAHTSVNFARLISTAMVNIKRLFIAR
jgi:hypothetical protein